MRHILRFSIVLMGISLLTACGSGIESSSDDGTVTGHLIDSGVEGVEYSTPTHHGVTGPGGSFLYIPKETVTFKLGDVALGSSVGHETVTLFDLVPGASVVSGQTAIQNNLWQYASPFQAVINLAILLQTFDQDGDPSNGIRITPEVRNLFTGKTLNLRQYWYNFGHNTVFRQALKSANDNSLLSNHRTVRNPALALNHLYDTLGVAIYVPSLTEFDYNIADGIDTVNHAYRVTYDLNGFPVEYAYYYDGNGAPGSIYSTVFDSEGNISSSSSDGNGGGVIDNFSYSSYDADGNLSFGFYYSVSSHNAQRVTYTNDENGNIATVNNDFSDDGVIDYLSTYTHDEFGNRLAISDDSSPGDSKATSSYVFEYDSYGNHTTGSYDYNADSNTDFIFTSTYNTQGLLISQANDTNGDGNTDTTDTFEYDNQGRQTVAKYGVESDGAVNILYTSVYDDKGRLVKTITDYGGDGNANYITTYEYDSHGNRTKQLEDSNGDNTPDTVSKTTYIKGGWGYYFYAD